MKSELSSGLNEYLADIGILYIKLHNLHWNVIGTQFKSIHEYLETLYDGFATVLDETAETLKIHGETPLASLKDFLSVSKIVELESKDYSVEEVLKITVADMAHMQDSAQKLRVLAGEEDDYEVVSMLEGHLKDYNKTLWFLNSMVK